MPHSKLQVKQETRVDKIRKSGRLKSTELSSRGREKDVRDAPLVSILSDSQSRSGVDTGFYQSWLTAPKLI